MEKQFSKAWIVLLQDCVLSCVTSLLSILLVRWLSDPVPGFTATVLVWVASAFAATLAASFATGSFKSVRRWFTLRSAGRLLYMVLLKEAILAVALLTGLVSLPEVYLSVLVVLADTVLTVAVIFYTRIILRMMSKSEISHVKHDASLRRALIAGTGEEAVAMAERISRSGQFCVVGYVSRDHSLAGRRIGEVVVFHCETIDDLRTLEWRLGGIDCIFFPPDNEYTAGGSAAVSSAGDIPVSDGMGLAGRVVKRGFDLVASSVLILIFLPLAIVSAVAVKLGDGGPVLYRQERIGKNARRFNILKFRSMRQDAEAAGAQLYSGEKDPRLTRVGAFLRAHHLDELPQLWNVFRGDMSFIGYRPERQVFIDRIMEHNPRYRYLYQIRPGVTSYATLYNGYTDTIEKMLTRLDLDLYYLRNRSLMFDLRVLALTFFSIIFGKKF